MILDNKEKSRSWYCVWNNPQIIYPDLEPIDLCHVVLDLWIDDKPTRTGAVAYCISADGLIHLHMVLEDSNQARFSAIKSLYPKAHIEPTKGTKEQAEAYIHKQGKFAEKGEQIIYIAKYGELKGSQGARKDLELIEDWIEQGLTPREIMRKNIRYRRYEKYIKDAYFDKRYIETDVLRPVDVFWHVGESGSGKTYTYVEFSKLFGEDHVYLVTDYDNGGLDLYNGEEYLFLDEFRGQIKYSTLLSMLQGYKQQFHSRYTNIIGLWNEVHISSVFPPDKVYQNMVSENQDIDTIKQLYRRIGFIVYHWKDDKGYHKFLLPMKQYKNLADLRERAMGSEFMPICKQETIPF